MTEDDEPEGTELSDLFGPGRTPLDERGRAAIELAPYGWTWLRVARPGDGRLG